MQGAAQVGGTIGAVTERADQPAITDADSPIAEQFASDAGVAGGEAADVPAPTEAPEGAPEASGGAGGHSTEPDGDAAGETSEAVAGDPAGDAAASPEPDDGPAGGTGASPEPDDGSAGEAAGVAAPDGGATGEEPAAAADDAEVDPAPEPPADSPTPPPAPAPAADDRSTGIGTPIPSAATTGGLSSGDIITGVVSSVERRELELDLGSGRVGVIGSRHWAAGLDVDLTVEAKVGDTVEAAVLVREDHKQRIVLSRSWGRQQRAWETAENARKTGEIISGTVTDAVAAGITVDIGVRAFVPASMAGSDDLESLVGTTVECKVTEVNQLKGRCILSRKAASRTRERQAARKRLAELEPGTMLRARVTKVEDFGALVLADGDLRGRIRRSELSWFRVRRPNDVVSVGDELEARVLQTAPAKMSLDLSLRIGDDPLAGISPGERHQATVTSLAPFGAFVAVGEGIRGLVPTAELSEHPIRHPREVVVPGDSVLTEVTKVDRQRRELEFSVNLAMLVRPSEWE